MTVASSKKVFIRTFGCQMNEYDSDKMADVLEAADGYTKTDRVEEADLILLNTCSVREKASEKMFSDLGRLREFKDGQGAKPGVLIGVGGCVASQEGEALVKRAPYVDLVFGPQTLHRLPAMIARRVQSAQAQVDISFPENEKFDDMPPARVDGPTAFVSIMEGCSKYCSFCVVPYTRGEEISRPFADVMTEIRELASRGIKEVTLLGQNVNAYVGKLMDPDSGEELDADFALLLTAVHEIPQIERIRYTTSHPLEFTQRLIDCYARLPKLVSQVHLPVQAGSDTVLAAMKLLGDPDELSFLQRELTARLQRFDAALAAMGVTTEQAGSSIAFRVVPFSGPGEAIRAAGALLEDAGFLTTPVYYPTVARGTGAIRISLSVGHKMKDVDALIA